jgi:hypothetical protein
VAFLERIRAAGGVAFVARDLRDVLLHLPTRTDRAVEGDQLPEGR